MVPIALTGTPVDLIAAASLDAGSVYTVQAEIPAGHGSNATVHLDDATTAPTNPNAGRKLSHLQIVRAQAGTGGRLWAWAPSGRGAVNIFAEP